MKAGALATLIVVAALVPAALNGQAMSGTGSIGLARVSRESRSGTAVHFSGFAVTGEAGVRVWRAGLTFDYLQGRLTPSGGGTGLDLVEGELALSVAPVPWMLLSAGRHIRSYVSSDATERWSFWESHLEVHTPIIAPSVLGYVTLSRTLHGGVNLPAALDPGQGFEVGVVGRLPRRPVFGRLGYRLHYTGAGQGARVETVETLLMTLGVALHRP